VRLGGTSAPVGLVVRCCAGLAAFVILFSRTSTGDRREGARVLTVVIKSLFHLLLNNTMTPR
jgi:hypothetical protein